MRALPVPSPRIAATRLPRTRANCALMDASAASVDDAAPAPAVLAAGAVEGGRQRNGIGEASHWPVVLQRKISLASVRRHRRQPAR